MANAFSRDPPPAAATPATSQSAPAPTKSGNAFSRDPPPVDAPEPEDIPLFSWTGKDKVGEFVGKMADSATAGFGAQALDKLGWAQGPNGQTVAKQVENAGTDIGPVASMAADTLGYAVGPGKFAMGEKLGAALGGKLLARMGGSAAENAGAAVLGNVGHGDTDMGDNLKAALLSGTVGAVTGAIPGRGARAGDASPTAALDAASSAAYAPLKNIPIHPGTVGPAFDGVTSKLTTTSNLNPEFKAKVAEISGEMADKFKNNKTVSADNVATYQKELMNNATTDYEKAVAGDYGRALHSSVGPWTSRAISDASAASGKAKTSSDIDNWITSAQKNPVKTSENIDQSLTNNPNFYGAARPLLTEAAKPPSVVSDLAMKLAHPVGDAVASGTADYMFGGHDIASALLAAGAGGIGGAAARHTMGQARTNALVSKLAQARHLNATGDMVPREAFAPGGKILGPLGAYARQGSPGLGASGAFMNIGSP